VEMYVSREETWEHIAMGHPTYRDQEAMASGLERELADWDARWRAASSQ
jgi:hypothetical protein